MQYTWLIWSLIILGLWVVIYSWKKNFRKIMLPVSLATLLFGFYRTIVWPAYWNPFCYLTLLKKQALISKV